MCFLTADLSVFMLLFIPMSQLLRFHILFPCLLRTHLRKLHMLCFFSEDTLYNSVSAQHLVTPHVKCQDLKHHENFSCFQALAKFSRKGSVQLSGKAMFRYLDIDSPFIKHG